MADRYDPFKDESLGTPQAKPRRKSPVMIDWKAVARRLAQGEAPDAVAAALGLREDRIWLHLKNSLRFRFLLGQALERQRLLSDLRLAAGGRTAVLGRGLQSEALDAEMLRCLLADEALIAAPDDLAQRIETLGQTARRPPNMALRARFAAERREMDAFVARSVALLKASQAPESEPEPADEAGRSETKSNEAEGSETNANEAERSETKANEANGSLPEASAPAVAQAESPPRRPPRPLRPLDSTRSPTIVDIEGPDLARLRAAGLIGPVETS